MACDEYLGIHTHLSYASIIDKWIHWAKEKERSIRLQGRMHGWTLYKSISKSMHEVPSSGRAINFDAWHVSQCVFDGDGAQNERHINNKLNRVTLTILLHSSSSSRITSLAYAPNIARCKQTLDEWETKTPYDWPIDHFLQTLVYFLLHIRILRIFIIPIKYGWTNNMQTRQCNRLCDVKHTK